MGTTTTRVIASIAARGSSTVRLPNFQAKKFSYIRSVMKNSIQFPLHAAGLLLLGLFASEGLTAAQPAETKTLSASVSGIEDEFIARLEKAAEPQRVFDEYEAQLLELVEKHPDDPAPLLGLMELFEKCETPQAKRVVDQILSREKLPEKVREAYEGVRKKLSLVGKPVGLELKALDGGAVRFDEFRGQVVLIDFWATWCGPCIRELPKLQALHARYERDGFVVVGVSFDRERSKLDAFLAARKIPWRQIYPDDAAKKTIADTLDVTGGYLPMVYIIGKDGTLRHTLNSRFRTEEKVAALLKE
jgi:thiol-disulfide isomerase/thioredoxin